MKINFTKFICVSDDFLQTDLFLKHLGVKGGWQCFITQTANHKTNEITTSFLLPCFPFPQCDRQRQGNKDDKGSGTL